MKSIYLNEITYTVVDDDDFEKLSKYRWFLSNPNKSYRYAVRKSNGRCVMMHRQVMNVRGKKYIDHIDGDGLNNCKSNLRVATNSQNQFNRKTSGRNKSGYRGVYLHKMTGKWEACLRYKGKRIYLGLHDTPEQASEAYLREARKVAGSFLNESP